MDGPSSEPINSSLIDIPERASPSLLPTESIPSPEAAAVVQPESVMDHPIQRCNQDVLSIIFEWVACEVHSSRSRVAVAAKLAMVCRRWRQIALQTPELWRYFDVSVNDRLPDIRTQWHGLRSVRFAAPDDICIKRIETGSISTAALRYIWQECEFSSLERIKRLEFVVTKPQMARMLLNQNIDLPDAIIEHLILDSNTSPSRFGTLACWDVSRLLAKFPSTRYLKFTRQSAFLFSSSHTFAHTTSLHITNCEQAAICAGLSSFVNLERLWVQATTIADSDNVSTILMPRLRWLCVHKANPFPWRQLRCPSLEVLTGDEWVSDPMIDFLKRHPHLCDIDVKVHTYSFASFARAVRHVESLDIGGYIEGLVEWQDTTDLVEPPFPHLKRLVLDRTDDGIIDRELFESIVKTYCLPLSHLDVQTNPRKQKLECLAVFGTTESLKEAKWAESTLLDGCSRTPRVYSHLSGWVCLEFRWALK